jgi:hypothetical protein
MKQDKKDRETPHNFAVNRQPGHYYRLLDKFEAGIDLTGTAVKSSAMLPIPRPPLSLNRGSHFIAS